MVDIQLILGRSKSEQFLYLQTYQLNGGFHPTVSQSSLQIAGWESEQCIRLPLG